MRALRPSTAALRAIAVLLVAMLLLVSTACTERKRPVMPDVTGMTVGEASAVLDRAGIRLKYTYGDYAPITVVATDPRAGEPVEREGVSFDLSEVFVTKVVDGDTFVVTTGDRIRLIGLDAPEPGRCGSARAKQFVAEMVKGTPVFVTNPPDVEDRDKYGRLLAYVSTNTVNDIGYQLLIKGLAVPRYNSSDGYGAHPSENVYARGAEEATPIRCAPVPKPAPVRHKVSVRSRWVCSYSPTYDRDWHNDVICTNGVSTRRPYLREWDSFVTQSEIMTSAWEYELQLNRS
jgi:endonuclease YncB( thermonuclease family)